MRKLLMSILLVASFGFVGLGTEAKANTAAAVDTPQIRFELASEKSTLANRLAPSWLCRTYVQTRLVRRGYATYRETYRVRSFSNGETSMTLISRVRVA